MGLDFTGIKDQAGVAIFVIHNGQSRSQQKMERLADDIKEHTTAQIITMSASDPAARKIIDFYGLKATNMVLLVRDDDQLQQAWHEGDIIDPHQIAYSANQIG